MTASGDMVQVDLKHLVRDRDRHGNVRVYVRLEGRRKVRLRDPEGSPEFLAAYQKAMTAAVEPAPAPGTRGTHRPPPKPGTFRWLCVRYMDSAEFKQLEASTRQVRRGILEHCWDEPIAPGSTLLFADFPIAKLTSKAIRVLRDRKAEAPESANGRIKAVRQVFSWALLPDVELAASNPARDVPYLRPKNRGGFHAWTAAEVEQYRKRHAIGTKARLALELLLLTAQRRSDVVVLGRQHVVAGRLRFTQRKGRNSNPISLDLPIHAELRQAIDATTTGRMTFLVTAFGKPFTFNGFGNWFKKRCVEAGLPHCSAHGLRKAGASQLAESGATDREIMAVTGHQTSKEVDRYTKAARQKRLATRAMARLSAGGNEN